MTEEWLILAADLIAAFHFALYLLLWLPAGLEVGITRWRRIRVLVFVVELCLVTSPSQWVFSHDCPLRLFEYCLRGLGGESFDPNRFRTMERLLSQGMPAHQIFQTVAWTSGVYVLALGVVMIITALLIDRKWQYQRKQLAR